MEMLDRKEDKAQVRVAICVPSTGMWHADFGFCLVQMLAYIGCNMFEPGQDRLVDVIDKRSSNLPRVRQEMLEDAILKNHTHALFIDSDQSFPMNSLHMLLSRKKQVIGANIAIKAMPSFPTARNRGPSPFGVPVTSDPWKTGIEKVWRIGAGMLLVDLSLVKTLPRPWFAIEYDESSGQLQGEDWYFVKKLEDAGADIWIDHDLSKMVGHVGHFNYGHVHVPSVELEKAA